nr:hypothetical protein Iba_chr14dCG8600 [Ipomoea batatas]
MGGRGKAARNWTVAAVLPWRNSGRMHSQTKKVFSPSNAAFNCETSELASAKPFVAVIRSCCNRTTSPSSSEARAATDPKALFSVPDFSTFFRNSALSLSSFSIVFFSFSSISFTTSFSRTNSRFSFSDAASFWLSTEVFDSDWDPYFSVSSRSRSTCCCCGRHANTTILSVCLQKVSVDADSITNVIPGGLFHSSPPCHIEWVAVNSDGDIWSFLLSCCPESLVTICRRHSLRRRPNCTPDYISLLLKCLFTSGLISSWPILRIKSQKPFQQTEGQRISVRKFLSKRHRLLLSHTSEVSQEDQSSNPADEQHFFQGIGAFQLKPQQRYSRCSIYQ